MHDRHDSRDSHDDREYDALFAGRGAATAERGAEADAERVAHGARVALRVLAPTGADEATLREVAARAGVAVEMLRPDTGAVLDALPAAPIAERREKVASLPVSSRGVVRQNETVAADLSQLALLMHPPQTRGEGGTPLRESFVSALRSLNANKMRAVLTMLGIIIGVSSVVIQLAIGNGLSGYIREDFERGFSSVVSVQGTEQRVNGVATVGRTPSLTVEDVRALAAPGAITDLVAISADVQGKGQVTYGGANASVSVVGVLPAYPVMSDYKIARGDFIADADEEREAPVAVLGAVVARTLFGERDPVGETLFVRGVAMQVIGVMAEQGGTGSGGGDNSVFLPLSTALNRVLGSTITANRIKAVDGISAKATSIYTVASVQAQIHQLLDARHSVAAEARDYETKTSLTIVTQVLRIIGAIGVVLVVISCVSLLVGGIGIMNIMLVSVTERTREIGIRKAVGARQGDILTQFVVEAIFISLVGAAIGLAVGGLGVLLVNIAWRPAPVSAAGVIGSVFAALFTGLIFGVAPARRAARMRPVEALRAE